MKTLEPKKRNHYPLEHWQGVIQHWKASGLSKKNYCQQQKITESVFKRWSKKLEALGSENPRQDKAISDRFIPVHWMEGLQGSSTGLPRLDIVMANGHHLWIQGSVEQLTSFLKPLLVG